MPHTITHIDFPERLVECRRHIFLSYYPERDVWFVVEPQNDREHLKQACESLIRAGRKLVRVQVDA